MYYCSWSISHASHKKALQPENIWMEALAKNFSEIEMLQLVTAIACSGFATCSKEVGYEGV